MIFANVERNVPGSFRSARSAKPPSSANDPAEFPPSWATTSRSRSTPSSLPTLFLLSRLFGSVTEATCSMNLTTCDGSRTPTATSAGRLTTGGDAGPVASGTCEALTPSVRTWKSSETPSESMDEVRPNVRSAATHGTFKARADFVLVARIFWKSPVTRISAPWFRPRSAPLKSCSVMRLLELRALRAASRSARVCAPISVFPLTARTLPLDDP